MTEVFRAPYDVWGQHYRLTNCQVLSTTEAFVTHLHNPLLRAQKQTVVAPQLPGQLYSNTNHLPYSNWHNMSIYFRVRHRTPPIPFSIIFISEKFNPLVLSLIYCDLMARIRITENGSVFSMKYVVFESRSSSLLVLNLHKCSVLHIFLLKFQSKEKNTLAPKRTLNPANFNKLKKIRGFTLDLWSCS